MSYAPTIPQLKKSLRHLHLAHAMALKEGHPEAVVHPLRVAIHQVHQSLDVIITREVPSQPLQSAVAFWPSATPSPRAKASHAAPAGAGAPSTRSRDGSIPAGPSASCLPSKDSTPAYSVPE